VPVQNAHAGHRLHGRDNLVHDLRPAGFRKIRDAFHNFHWHFFLQALICLDYTKPRGHSRPISHMLKNNK
jgi:hypothetical protein